MPRRKCSTNNELERKTTRQIIVPLSEEAHHLIVEDAALYREWRECMIVHYPELFPADIQAGYTLHSILPESKKMPGERKRRIELKARDENGKRQVYTIAPSYLMPYMTGYTDPRAAVRKVYISPAHRLNDFFYHENWLQNLLISSSGQAVYAHHRIR